MTASVRSSRRGLPALLIAAGVAVTLQSCAVLFTSSLGKTLGAFQPQRLGLRYGRLPRAAVATAATDLVVGAAVEAVFEEDGMWYPAVVEKDNGDGTYDVKWDDPDGGPEISCVNADNIKEYVPPIPLSDLEVGSKHTGTITGVRPFGAFVNLGAERDGLVHVSCIREGYVENIDDEVEVGQEVDVWIRDVDLDSGKIGLTMVEGRTGGRRERPSRPAVDLDAFDNLIGGDKIAGTVVSVKGFGAFVEVAHPESGEPVQGLVHVSQLSNDYVEDPNDIVQPGQEVEVSVRDIRDGKLSLSMKDQY